MMILPELFDRSLMLIQPVTKPFLLQDMTPAYHRRINQQHDYDRQS